MIYCTYVWTGSQAAWNECFHEKRNDGVAGPSREREREREAVLLEGVAEREREREGERERERDREREIIHTSSREWYTS